MECVELERSSSVFSVSQSLVINGVMEIVDWSKKGATGMRHPQQRLPRHQLRLQGLGKLKGKHFPTIYMPGHFALLKDI